MTKAKLNLSIDTELLDLAKQSNLNLSSEFEEWVKIRLNKNILNIENETLDYDKEYARLQLELQKLESKKEMIEKQDSKDKEKIMVIDHVIDNQIEYDKAEDIAEKRFAGIKFLFKQKFNENITDLDAKNLINNRLMERGLIDGI